MPRQSNEFEVYAYLDASVLGGKWVFVHHPKFLSLTCTDGREDREFRASYDESENLVLSIRIGGVTKHQKETDTRLTSAENTSGARLLLEMALYMLAAGALDPGDITDALAPRRLPDALAPRRLPPAL